MLSFRAGFNSLRNQQVTYFMVKFLLLLALWSVVRYVTGPEETIIEERNVPAIAPSWMYLQQQLRYVLLWVNKMLLLLIGYEHVYTDDYLVAVKGFAGVSIGDPCLAIEMMALYASLVLATNSPLKIKMIGLAIGIAGIQVINVARIMAINLMTIYCPAYANVAHHYMFNTVVFIAILLMFNYFLHYKTK